MLIEMISPIYRQAYGIDVSRISIQPIVDTVASFPYILHIPVVICCQGDARESVLNQQSLICCNYALHAGEIINSDRNKFGEGLFN